SAVARTPTSAWINASSSRSHAWSSPGSNAAAWICSVSARRDFESESRSRENIPACRSSGSGAPSASPSSCAQLLATAAPDSRDVERGLNLVEQVERTRPREEQREEERDRAERLLAAREKRQPLHPLAGRPQLDLDPRLALLVLGVRQAQTSFAAGEERR